MTFTYTKPRNREKLLERSGANAIHQRIKQMDTVEEKRELVLATNPFIYIFGQTLIPTNHYTADYKEESWEE